MHDALRLNIVFCTRIRVKTELLRTLLTTVNARRWDAVACLVEPIHSCIHGCSQMTSSEAWCLSVAPPHYSEPIANQLEANDFHAPPRLCSRSFLALPTARPAPRLPRGGPAARVTTFALGGRRARLRLGILLHRGRPVVQLLNDFDFLPLLGPLRAAEALVAQPLVRRGCHRSRRVRRSKSPHARALYEVHMETFRPLGGGVDLVPVRCKAYAVARVRHRAHRPVARLAHPGVEPGLGAELVRPAPLPRARAALLRPPAPLGILGMLAAARVCVCVGGSGQSGGEEGGRVGRSIRFSSSPFNKVPRGRA